MSGEPVDNRVHQRIRVTLTVVIAVSAGFLFVASGLTASGTDLRSGGVDDLRGLVIERAGTVGILTARAAKAQDEVDAASEELVDPVLTARIASLKAAAGLTEVSGSALEVTLDDAPRLPGSSLPDGVAPDDLVVHQQDVQAVVNAMWRGGATAVVVMDQRVISTTAIRCVGNTLLLQGRVYSPPFTVTAIGDVGALQRALDTEPGVVIYRQYVDRLSLGWKVTQMRNATLPPYLGAVS